MLPDTKRGGIFAMGHLTAQFDLPLAKDAPAASRRATTTILHGWGYQDQEWLAAVAVVVSELVTNAVRHGGGCVAYAFEAYDGQVHISVADGSSVIPRRRKPDGSGGYGLGLIEALADDWGVHDHQGGKLVWVRLARAPSVLLQQERQGKARP
jgi:anti-sigma regulatory factor (Ser/Thr protein kinase)